MRLRTRNSVELPHPDGPMMAVTFSVYSGSEMSLSALSSP